MSEQMILDPLLRELSSSNNPQKHEIAVSMIENGADISSLDVEGNTLLQVAVKSEAFAVIEAILKLKKPANLTDDYLFDSNESLMALAMRSPNAVKLLTMFYKYGAYDFAKCCKLLPWSMSEDHLGEVVRTLLQLTDQTSESDVANCIKDSVGKNRRLAKLLISCATVENNKMIKLQNLLSYDCVVTSPVTVAFLISEGAEINNDVNYEKQYLLHLACHRRVKKTVSLLLHMGADVNVTDRSEDTPFSMCFFGNWEYEFDKSPNSAIRCMIEHFACLNVAGKKVNEKDLSFIRGTPKLQRYYDSCMEELERMKTMEAADGFPCYWFFSKTNYQLSLLVRNIKVCNQIKKNLIRLDQGVFPTYKNEVIVKFGLARKISKLVEIREREIEEVFGEDFPCRVIQKVLKYSLDLKNFEKDHYLTRFL